MTYYSLQAHVTPSYENIKSHCTILYLGEQSSEVMDRIEIGGLFEAYSNMGIKFPIKVSAETDLTAFGPNGEMMVQIINSLRLVSANALARDFFYTHGLALPETYPWYRPHISLPNGRPNGWSLFDEVVIHHPHLHIWESNNDTP